MSNQSGDCKFSIVPALLVVVLTVAIMGMILSLLLFSIPVENEKVLLIILGVVLSEWKGSMGYYTSTTRSSAEKSMLINKHIVEKRKLENTVKAAENKQRDTDIDTTIKP